MKIISINTGQIQSLPWQGKNVETAIFKKATTGIQKVNLLGIEGDKQADSKYHGGYSKAIYCYDSSHYNWWKENLDNVDWEWGMFGENLTTEGFLDKNVRVGNIYSVGSVVFQALEPRIPCFKLNIRFGREGILDHFYTQKNYGIYCKILTEGHLESGDSIQLIEEAKVPITIADVSEIYVSKGNNQDLLNAVLESPFIYEDLKKTLLRFKK